MSTHQWEVWDKLHRCPRPGVDERLLTIYRSLSDALPDEPEDSDLWRVGVLLLAAFQVTPNIARLREFTGLPINCITSASWYLRRAGIWQGKRNYTIVIDWLEPDMDAGLATVSFMLDCMVGAGRVRRVTDVDGKHSYRARHLGDFTQWEDASGEPVLQSDLVDVERNERRRLARRARKTS